MQLSLVLPLFGVSAALLGATAPISGKSHAFNSGKRGLAFNDPKYTQPFSQSSQVSWAYNWGSWVNGLPSLIRFIPRLWNDAQDATALWNPNVGNAHGNLGADAVLSFNEPDLCNGGGSCMSVSQAVSSYRRWIQPRAGQLLLGASAVSASDDPNQGLNWLGQFIDQCSGCTIDFIDLHWYGGQNVDWIKNFLTKAHDRFKKLIWVTEYGLNEGDRQASLSWLEQVTPWMDQQDWISRYAYFIDAPGDKQLINSNGNGLNSIGQFYNGN